MEQINSLQDELDKIAKDIGVKSSKKYFDQGIDKPPREMLKGCRSGAASCSSWPARWPTRWCTAAEGAGAQAGKKGSGNPFDNANKTQDRTEDFLDGDKGGKGGKGGKGKGGRGGKGGGGKGGGGKKGGGKKGGRGDDRDFGSGIGDTSKKNEGKGKGNGGGKKKGRAANALGDTANDRLRRLAEGLRGEKAATSKAQTTKVDVRDLRAGAKKASTKLDKKTDTKAKAEGPLIGEHRHERGRQPPRCRRGPR